MGLTVILSEEQIETVTSHADGAFRLMRELGIDRQTLEASLLDANVERCKNMKCGWYGEAFEMLDDEGDPDGFCDNCRKYDAPEKPEN